MNVVFVCTGNICRSPMAEKLLAAEIDAIGLSDRVRVSSAGTGHWHIGSAMDSRAAEVLDLVLATQGWRRFTEQTPPGYIARPVAPVKRRLQLWEDRTGLPACYCFHWANLVLAEELRSAIGGDETH